MSMFNKQQNQNDDYQKSFMNVFSQLIHENKENDKQIRIAVEGNIGSGKSTILQFLEKSFGNKRPTSNQKVVKLYQEPVDKWRNLNGSNLLELLYTDPKRWCFTVQSYIQLTMMEQHLKDNDNKSLVKVLERSIYSSRYCFIENLHRSGLLEKCEYDILNKWFEFLISNNKCDLDVIFYLRTDPDICYERIHARNRFEEVSNIDVKYLEDLHNLHEKWLIDDSSKKLYRPNVIVIDANQSMDDVCKRIYKEAHVIMN